jgi:hypothetical protein
MWFALVGAPLAWSLQLLINFSLTSHACYPHGIPLAASDWHYVRVAAAGVEVLAASVCLAALVVASLNWRRTHAEKAGDADHLVESGDGRTRFMAMCGVISSVLFLLATSLAALNLTTVPTCGG